MTDTFKVGELVILKNADYWVEHDGAPAVVIGPYILRFGTDLRSMQRRYVYTYNVRILVNPPSCILARPDQMRKLHDDSDGHAVEHEQRRDPSPRNIPENDCLRESTQQPGQ